MIFTHCELRLHFQCLLTNTLPPSQAFPDRDPGLKGDLRTVNWRTVVPAPLLLTDSFHAFVGQDNKSSYLAFVLNALLHRLIVCR